MLTFEGNIYGEVKILRNMIYKLTLFSVVLIIVVMIFSMISVDKTLYLEHINSKFMLVLYLFALQNVATTLTPAICAVGYAFALFSLLKESSKRRIIAAISSLLLVIFSLASGIAILNYTPWFDNGIITTFTQNMTIIGLLTIILFFIFDFIKRNKKF